MPFFLYASFPNSRVKPRPSTQSANTYQVALVDQTQPLTLIAPPNPNRTYILLKNLSQTTALWYVYLTPVLVDPTIVATNGVQYELVLFGGQLYQKQDDGVTTNWVAVNVEDVAESVDPLQTASLDEVASYLYAAAASAAPVVPQVLAGIDEGRG